MKIILFFCIFLTSLFALDLEQVTIKSKEYINIPKLNLHSLEEHTFYITNKKLTSFKIAKYETSVKEYIHYLKASKQTKKLQEVLSLDMEVNEPITNISFYEARSTCKYYGGRLPTEFEWTTAASIKLSKSKCYEHLKLNSFHSIAVDKLNSTCMMKFDDEFEEREVGSELNDVELSVENINGTFGMYGNVWEWVDSSKAVFKSEYKIIKGGSFTNFDKAQFFDSRVSNFLKPHETMQNVGFRCAWDIDTNKKSTK